MVRGRCFRLDNTMQLHVLLFAAGQSVCRRWIALICLPRSVNILLFLLFLHSRAATSSASSALSCNESRAGMLCEMCAHLRVHGFLFALASDEWLGILMEVVLV